MKKKLLWILPAALALILLLGLGIYLDHCAPVLPPVEVLDSSTSLPETEEPTDATQRPVEPSVSETEPEETESPSETEPTVQTEPTAPSYSVEASTQPTEPPVTEPDTQAQDRIDALVAEVYTLRDYYTGQLLALEASAAAQYNALPPEERTPQKKQDIALSCIDAAYALESECDARMDSICQELSYLLLETGGSMRLITDIRYAYASEKETARTAFLQKYASYFG